MKFNFQRAKTPAYLTSLALVVIGLLFATGSAAVAGWIFVIAGIALNVMAVSITSVDGSSSRARTSGTRVVDEVEAEDDEPEADTEQHDAVPPADDKREGRKGSSGLSFQRRGAGPAASSSIKDTAARETVK